MSCLHFSTNLLTNFIDHFPETSKIFANEINYTTSMSDEAAFALIVIDAVGERFFVFDDDTHFITETRDAQGRPTGYVYSKNGATQQTVTTGYGADGRINSAGFDNAPRKCIAKISQEYCQYICECPKGYYWFDLGTGYEQLYRPCSEPDTITSGTCKAKKPYWLTSPKPQRQAKRIREYRFPANLPPHLAYRNASLPIMSLGIVIMLLYYGILSRA